MSAFDGYMAEVGSLLGLDSAPKSKCSGKSTCTTGPQVQRLSYKGDINNDGRKVLDIFSGGQR